MGRPSCVIETRSDAAFRVRRSSTTSRSTSRDSATARKWHEKLAGRANGAAAPAARSATVAT